MGKGKKKTGKKGQGYAESTEIAGPSHAERPLSQAEVAGLPQVQRPLPQVEVAGLPQVERPLPQAEVPDVPRAQSFGTTGRKKGKKYEQTKEEIVRADIHTEQLPETGTGETQGKGCKQKQVSQQGQQPVQERQQPGSQQQKHPQHQQAWSQLLQQAWQQQLQQQQAWQQQPQQQAWQQQPQQQAWPQQQQQPREAWQQQQHQFQQQNLCQQQQPRHQQRRVRQQSHEQQQWIQQLQPQHQQQPRQQQQVQQQPGIQGSPRLRPQKQQQALSQKDIHRQSIDKQIERLSLTGSPTLNIKLTSRRTGGTEGSKIISVYTNHFPLQLRKVQWAIHYDVAIVPDKQKKLYRPIMEAFRKKYYSNRYPSYDGSKSLYSASALPFPSGELTGNVTISEDGRNKEYRVTIKFATYVDLTCINSYISQRGFEPTPMQALQCLDVVLRSAPVLKCIPCGRSFFTVPEGRTYTLGDGAELYYGFYQSAILGWKPFLNVDVAHKAFPMALNIIDLIKDMFRLDDGSLQHALGHRQLVMLNKHLRNLKVQYELPGNIASRRVYRVYELQETPASASFQLENGRRTTVKEYYRTDKNVNLMFPNLPCLGVGSRIKRILLPCELCTVLKGQVVNRKMTDNQTRSLIKKAATNTTDRLTNIKSSVHHANYNPTQNVREFDLSISEEPELVQARVLQPPVLKYRDSPQTVNKGVWRAGVFEVGASLKKWTILCLDKWTKEEKLLELERQILTASKSLGMNIQPAHRPFRSITSFEKKLLQDLTSYFKSKKGYELIVVVISDFSVAYNYVKQSSEIAVGCLTQCIKTKTLYNLKKSTVENILLKINAKLGGRNHSLNTKPPILLKPCIIMGADVTHPSPDSRDTPSVAAVTASYEASAFKYNFCWRLQDPTVEIIGDLEAITREQLLYFYNYNRQTKPERIVFFRDGVSDGQFNHVLNTELKAIRRACASLEPDYKPKITFLVVQKRHHTRFFPKNPADSEDRNCNVPAGTCVDTVITHPAAQDFYLVSHASIQGVAKPTKYRTLWDDADMSDDEVEQLTYYLCHLFARCNRSVSYPAPTYYAHLAAARAKVYCETERIDMNNLIREQQRLRVQDCIIKQLPMFFV